MNWYRTIEGSLVNLDKVTLIYRDEDTLCFCFDDEYREYERFETYELAKKGFCNLLLNFTQNNNVVL